MEEQKNLQLELFSQSGDSSALPSSNKNSYFLTKLWNYEKTILTIIGIIITSLISFSLGVEKGKRTSQIAPQVNNPKVIVPARVVIPEQQNYAKVPVQQVNQGFVIQLGSYKSKITLQKEIESLKKRGYSPSVSSKGAYSVLYVGNFANKETAQSQFSELKKRFKDCYIRRL